MEFFLKFLEEYQYLAVFLGPFVQEDAAVLTAATLSATGTGKTAWLFISVTIGLFLSDIWKYWIGWAALKNKKGSELANKKQVLDLKDKVQTFAFSTLLTARFVPLTRVPTLVACGFFGISYVKYCIYIAITAIAYVAIIFSSFHVLGEVFGEQVRFVVPIIIGLGAVFYIIYKSRKSKSKPE